MFAYYRVHKVSIPAQPFGIIMQIEGGWDRDNGDAEICISILPPPAFPFPCTSTHVPTPPLMFTLLEQLRRIFSTLL